ncbi:MAG: M56 family metallopeptidase, partial [bacterium]|nr:M56 family metallopeptidase [bacterium]
MTDTILAWLLTYWLHSTIALGGMWLASRFLRNRNLALEEAGWKAALFVTLFTSALQLGLASVVEYRPLAGALVLEAAEPRPQAVDIRMSEPREKAFDLRGDAENDGAEATMTTPSPDPMATGAGLSLGMARPRGRILAIALFLWLVATSILLTRFVISYVLLLSRLKGRRRLSSGPHVALLARLRRRAGVARRVGLSVCTALAVPLALGLRRWEVCLPSKVTEEFSAEEQETVLAHELAHLVRYDALWLLAVRMLAGSFFFQPLNFVAVSRLGALSELRCDDWAVERTGRPVTLAKCLTRVASWRSNRWGAFPVPAMASSSRSQFGARVRRLVARSYP